MYRKYGSSVWTVFTHDYDSVFDIQDVLASANVFEYVLDYFGEYNPARYRSLINNNATFTDYYRKVLSVLFPSLPSVYLTFAEFVQPMYNMDLLQQFSFNHNATDYKLAVKNTVQRLQERYKNVSNQIAF